MWDSYSELTADYHAAILKGLAVLIEYGVEVECLVSSWSNEQLLWSFNVFVRDLYNDRLHLIEGAVTAQFHDYSAVDPLKYIPNEVVKTARRTCENERINDFIFELRQKPEALYWLKRASEWYQPDMSYPKWPFRESLEKRAFYPFVPPEVEWLRRYGMVELYHHFLPVETVPPGESWDLTITPLGSRILRQMGES